jgi:hypothetical protein
MKKYFAIIILAICSSCGTTRELELNHRTVVVVDTVVSREKLRVVDSVFYLNDTVHHHTHEVVDRYIYKTNSNSDTIYVQERIVEQAPRHSNVLWYIIAAVVVVLLILYGIYRKK